MRLFILSLSLLVLNACGDAPTISERSTQDDFSTPTGRRVAGSSASREIESERANIKVSDFSAPLEVSFDTLGVCSEVKWDESPAGGELADVSFVFWDCATSSQAGPYLDVNVKLPIKMSCGCNPVDSTFKKEAAGQYRARHRLAAGEWFVELQVEHAGQKEKKRLELTVP